ncbi:MAG: hypothetical protein LQ344_006197 [Seirophora lacunosa]|nr:MAG: hypothetical protein LQ344_006197 [Seirophora lacunosa]
MPKLARPTKGPNISTRATIRIRPVATTATSTSTVHKSNGDISSVFPSLSGAASPPLPPRFADLKKRLIRSHESDVRDSWRRLLVALQQQRQEIKALGSTIVPEINFWDLNDVARRTRFRDGLHKRGVAVVRGVVPEKEALDWKELLQRYIRTNPSTRGFPPANPAVYELYWSPSQILARAHPNILRVQRFLMSHWRATPSSSRSQGNNAAPLISTSHPVAYADRLRIRQPGDSSFALGPHIDGGSVERWEEHGYGLGGVYNPIFHGDWERYDPWESTSRLAVKSDLYNGAGACSMYRMFQGWLTMSETGTGEGHLMVCPMVKEAMAYLLLRPFFTPQRDITAGLTAFLEPENWTLEHPTSSTLQGAVPANGQELSAAMHPHLGLEDTMVHVPRVRPGDYVAWHCDTIHAVDSVHSGASDSSVLYIPACPLTEANAQYTSPRFPLRRRRA